MSVSMNTIGNQKDAFTSTRMGGTHCQGWFVHGGMMVRTCMNPILCENYGLQQWTANIQIGLALASFLDLVQ